MTIAVICHLAAALAFALPAALAIISTVKNHIGKLLIAASAATSLWAMAVVIESFLPEGRHAYSQILEVLRSCLWIAFLSTLIFRKSEIESIDEKVSVRQKVIIAALAAVVLFVVLIAALPETLAAAYVPAAMDPLLRLGLAVAGLVALENILRNTDQMGLWAIKFAVFGVGLIFICDLALYSLMLMQGTLEGPLYAARGGVDMLAAPLLAVAASRNRDWQIDIRVSRDAVFHGTTLVASGVFLMAVAATGAYLRRFGGDWVAVLEIMLLALALLAMVIALFSGSVRAYLRLQISKHFFPYRYDYRFEWRRFIDTLAATSGELGERTVKALAVIVDSAGGALWVHRDQDAAFVPIANWNYRTSLPYVALDAPLIKELSVRPRILNLKAGDEAEVKNAPLLPEWLEELADIWLVVPLVHRDVLQGFLILSDPITPQQVTWEERDLLMTAGRQVASYLAEEEAARSLVDAQRFDEFNRRFAFVVHDLKNMASQLSLVLSNAEKFGDNPDFQRDAWTTVRNTSNKMSELLSQLRRERQDYAEHGHDHTAETETLAGDVGASDKATLALPQRMRMKPMIDRIVSAWRATGAQFEWDCADTDLEAVADPEKLDKVLAHLVLNAVEAAGIKGKVTVRLQQRGEKVCLDIQDDGPGMDADFVQNELFRPLQSTKEGGYGIGAYQTRELVKEMGGILEVSSVPGQGTTMRVVLDH